MVGILPCGCGSLGSNTNNLILVSSIVYEHHPLFTLGLVLGFLLYHGTKARLNAQQVVYKHDQATRFQSHTFGGAHLYSQKDMNLGVFNVI